MTSEARFARLAALAMSLPVVCAACTTAPEKGVSYHFGLTRVSSPTSEGGTTLLRTHVLGGWRDGSGAYGLGAGAVRVLYAPAGCRVVIITENPHAARTLLDALANDPQWKDDACVSA